MLPLIGIDRQSRPERPDKFLRTFRWMPQIQKGLDECRTVGSISLDAVRQQHEEHVETSMKHLLRLDEAMRGISQEVRCVTLRTSSKQVKWLHGKRIKLSFPGRRFNDSPPFLIRSPLIFAGGGNGEGRGCGPWPLGRGDEVSQMPEWSPVRCGRLWYAERTRDLPGMRTCHRRPRVSLVIDACDPNVVIFSEAHYPLNLRVARAENGLSLAPNTASSLRARVLVVTCQWAGGAFIAYGHLKKKFSP